MSSVKTHPWAPGSLLRVNTSLADNLREIPLFEDDLDGFIIASIPNKTLVLYVDCPEPGRNRAPDIWPVVKVLSGETIGWVHQWCLAKVRDESELEVL